MKWVELYYVMLCYYNIMLHYVILYIVWCIILRSRRFRDLASSFELGLGLRLLGSTWGSRKLDEVVLRARGLGLQLLEALLEDA